jgi:Xaa-Pro dipeptidase
MDNFDRLERMRRAMESERLDVLVLRLPENVLFLSGFWPMIGATLLVFPREGEPLCIIPHCYENEAAHSLWNAQTTYYRYGVLGAEPVAAIRSILSDAAREKNWARVGYEGSFEVVGPSWNTAEAIVPAAPTRRLLAEVFDGAELVDVTALLEFQRQRKTPWEAAKLRTASEISCIGMEAFEQLVDVGVSGVELAAEAERAIMVRGTGYNGALRVRAFAQVAVGHAECGVGYRPNEISTVRELKAGEPALLELGVVVDGYWADRTRVRVAGEPTDEQERVFETVRKAQEAAIAAIRPGVRAAEVDEAARAVIRDAGWGDLFPHITGHGLGFRYHESAPLLAPNSSDILQEGMFTSVEPGIYELGVGGFRLEDDVLVTAGGAEIVGPYPKRLAGIMAEIPRRND